MSNQNAPELVITLTGREPVRVRKADWPIIAEARAMREPNGRVLKWKLTVRRHKDGRAIVYGVHTNDHRQSYLGMKPQPNTQVRGGRLLAAGENIPEALAAVAEDLNRQQTQGAVIFPDLAQKAAAALPAEKL